MDTVELNPDFFPRLHRAVKSAFDLRGLVLATEKLGVSLSAVANVNTSLEIIVFELLRWADSQSRVGELVSIVAELRPVNEDLRALRIEFEQATITSAKPPVDGFLRFVERLREARRILACTNALLRMVDVLQDVEVTLPLVRLQVEDGRNGQTINALLTNTLHGWVAEAEHWGKEAEIPEPELRWVRRLCTVVDDVLGPDPVRSDHSLEQLLVLVTQELTRLNSAEADCLRRVAVKSLLEDSRLLPRATGAGERITRFREAALRLSPLILSHDLCQLIFGAVRQGYLSDDLTRSSQERNDFLYWLGMLAAARPNDRRMTGIRQLAASFDLTPSPKLGERLKESVKDLCRTVTAELLQACSSLHVSASELVAVLESAA